MPHLLRLISFVAAAATVVGLAACGGGSGDDADSARAKAQDAGIKFARCMRAHGVSVADPKGPGISFHFEGSNPTALQTAQQACEHFLRDSAKAPSAAQAQKVKDNALKFAHCMRDHGVDFPDPQFSAGGKVTMRLGGPGGPNPDDPTLQAAQRACQHFMGPPPPGGPGGKSTAGGGKPQAGFTIQVGPKP
jgi:hypothetical protein